MENEESKSRIEKRREEIEKKRKDEIINSIINSVFDKKTIESHKAKRILHSRCEEQPESRSRSKYVLPFDNTKLQIL